MTYLPMQRTLNDLGNRYLDVLIRMSLFYT
jgi:hypothetical protein